MFRRRSICPYREIGPQNPTLSSPTNRLVTANLRRYFAPMLPTEATPRLPLQRIDPVSFLLGLLSAASAASLVAVGSLGSEVRRLRSEVPPPRTLEDFQANIDARFAELGGTLRSQERSRDFGRSADARELNDFRQRLGRLEQRPIQTVVEGVASRKQLENAERYAALARALGEGD